MILFTVNSLIGQESKVIGFEYFMDVVKNHHPIATAAQLQIQKGEAEVQSARGYFDPKLDAGIKQKYFDGKEYYDLSDGKLKIPTWFGVEFEGGYTQNEGIYLNPQNTVPNAGLWHAGVSIPLGEGLFIDKRRAMLRKAQIFQESTSAERDKLLNELYFEAAKAYWEWFESYNKLLIYQEALDLANSRFEFVKTSARVGDSPSIDTLESSIQVQNRELFLQQAELEFKNQSANLSVYLWLKGNIPLQIQDGSTPEITNSINAQAVEKSLYGQLDTLINQHPELLLYQFKMKKLDIEERWRKEQLKPDLNLKYNPIAEAVNDNPLSEYSINNYTWGLQFSFPLFLRKERGQLNFIKLEQQETSLQYDLKRQSLINKARMALNDWATSKDLHDLYTQTTSDYFSLLSGERRLFEIGESSLFLVNSRELGYINARLKLLELLVKNQIAQAKTAFALGTLNF